MTGGLFILRSGEVTLNSLVYVTDDLGVYVTDDLGGKTHPGVNAGQPLIQIRPQFTLVGPVLRKVVPTATRY